MANKTRFNIAKRDIVALFEARSQRVYRERELSQVVAANRSTWRLALSTGIEEFVELMAGVTPLQVVSVELDGQEKKLYTWGKATAFEVAVGIVPRAYLSHYTALYLHELTEQIPKQIFVNQEQSAKAPSAGQLTQADLDASFTRPQLPSQSRGAYEAYTFVLLHGKHTGELGVMTQAHFAAGRVRLTSIERTLIDVVVRPDYAGGVHQVLDAYRRAAGKVSVNRLVGLLGKLAYRYPYHQAIGFYMEKAGNYKASQLNLLRKLAQPLDFYLTHEMRTTAYSPEWRLYYPPGF
jgi:hypothetical protein